MKMPKRPPDLEAIRGKIEKSPEILKKLFSFFQIPPDKNKYLHWDKLRYYSPPKGLSHEQWWLAIKSKRQSLNRNLPLTDKNKKAFNFLTIDHIYEALHKIDLSTVTFNQMPEEIKRTETKNRYYVRSMIQEAFTSSQLEGAATTRKVAKDMLQKGRPPVDRSEQMILNNFAAMKHI